MCYTIISHYNPFSHSLEYLYNDRGIQGVFGGIVVSELIFELSLRVTKVSLAK